MSLVKVARRDYQFVQAIEEGFVEGHNVTIEYRWLEGQDHRLPELAADLVRRRVAVIATPGNPPATVRSVMATTAAIPIVFGVADDPVKWGLVAELAELSRMAIRVAPGTSSCSKVSRFVTTSLVGGKGGDCDHSDRVFCGERPSRAWNCRPP